LALGPKALISDIIGFHRDAPGDCIAGVRDGSIHLATSPPRHLATDRGARFDLGPVAA